MREGWEYKKLGEILIFDKRFNGISKEEQPKIAHFCHVSAEVLKSLRTEKGEVKLLSTGLFSASTTIDLAGNYINEGEVVTIPTGGVANIKYYKGKFVDSGNILGVSSGPQIVLKFVFYGMIAYKELINSYFRGVSIKHPYMPDIYNIPIPLPPFTEQQRIVEELDLLSSIIEKKKAQLKELDSLAQSIFYDMFGDPVTNEKGWEVKKLENIIKVIGGYAFKSTNFKEKGIPVLRIGNINSGEFKNSSMVFWERDDKLHKYLMHPGDLVMSLTGTVGKSDYGNICILDNSYKEYYLNQRNAQLKLKENVDKYYLSSILRFDIVKSKLTDVSRGVRQANISNKDIENLQIPLPPLPLQQQFAEKVEAIEHQKELIKQSIKEVETLFNSRMDYYFDG